MFDLQTTKDANGHRHAVITQLGGAEPTINTNALPASNAALITGKYSCDDGGIYYVTVVNNEVWGFGNSNDKAGPMLCTDISQEMKLKRPGQMYRAVAK
jgi:hypothetical protein